MAGAQGGAQTGSAHWTATPTLPLASQLSASQFTTQSILELILQHFTALLNYLVCYYYNIYLIL